MLSLTKNLIKTSTRSNIMNLKENLTQNISQPREIETFPDLQNGPSTLIQGSAVEIQQVGIHNFRIPLKYKTRDNGIIELETKVTGTVSLEIKEINIKNYEILL